MVSHRLLSRGVNDPFDCTPFGMAHVCLYPGCHRRFHLLSSMSRHQRHKHSKPRCRPFNPRRSWKLSDKPLACNYPGCNRSYFSSSGLLSHKRQKHMADYASIQSFAHDEVSTAAPVSTADIPVDLVTNNASVENEPT